MYCCLKDIDRCPYKRQVTTINQARNECLNYCKSQIQKDWTTDMYSSNCGKMCQKYVDQVIKKYGYSPCEKKIQPSVYWYQQPIEIDTPQLIHRYC